jgi:hypothetical protein
VCVCVRLRRSKGESTQPVWWTRWCVTTLGRRVLSEPAVSDRRGIGFGWLQNTWLLHARLKLLGRGEGGNPLYS